MKNYFFEDCYSGVDFIVEEDSYEKALLTAKLYYVDPEFIDEISDDEAEMSGFDTYQKGENYDAER